VESDAYQWWKVVDRVWCLLCHSREENGKDSGICARCQGDLALYEAELLED